MFGRRCSNLKSVFTRKLLYLQTPCLNGRSLLNIIQPGGMSGGGTHSLNSIQYTSFEVDPCVPISQTNLALFPSITAIGSMWTNIIIIKNKSKRCNNISKQISEQVSSVNPYLPKVFFIAYVRTEGGWSPPLPRFPIQSIQFL